MSSARTSSALLLILASVAAVTVQAACTESNASPAGSTDPGSDTDGASLTPDSGGTMAAPFTCPRDAIQGEPRPASIVLEQLRTAAGLDVLEERRVFEATTDAGAGAPSERAGAPCATATDRKTCETAFTELSSGGETLRPPFDEVDFMRGTVRGYYLAYTKADVVGVVSNATELRALFPTIDTPAKALLYANAAGYRVECHREAGWIREEPDGWVIVASRDHAKRCSRTDVVLWLKRDGTTEERDVIENQRDTCT